MWNKIVDYVIKNWKNWLTLGLAALAKWLKSKK